MSVTNVCAYEVVEALFQKGQNLHFTDPSHLQLVMNRASHFFGLNAAFLKARYERMNQNPELLRLMKGFTVPAREDVPDIHVWGGWGTDFIFTPARDLVSAIQDNFSPLADRLAAKLDLDDILMRELFRQDHISLMDSGWIIVEWKDSNGAVKRGSIKVTFFDYDMTPDGPFPRYALHRPDYNHFFVLHSRSSRLTHEQQKMVDEGFAQFSSSVSSWGILPLELETGIWVPEHQGVFEKEFLHKHEIYMENVIDHFGKPDLPFLLEKLQQLRERNLPRKSLLVAEVQRFNIPDDAPPPIIAHIFHGLSVLLHSRPEIETYYLLAPIPANPTGRIAWSEGQLAEFHPVYRQLVRVAQGWAVAHHHLPPASDNPSDVPRDLKKRLYSILGFEMYRQPPWVDGLPNGANIMKNSRERLLQRLGQYQLQYQRYLLPEQLELIEGPTPD